MWSHVSSFAFNFKLVDFVIWNTDINLSCYTFICKQISSTMHLAYFINAYSKEIIQQQQKIK